MYIFKQDEFYNVGCIIIYLTYFEIEICPVLWFLSQINTQHMVTGAIHLLIHENSMYTK